MKKSIKTIKAIILGAILLGAMLIAGGIDNDYTEQTAGSKPCREVQIANGTTICQ